MSCRYNDNFWGWLRSVTDRIPFDLISLTFAFSWLVNRFGIDKVMEVFQEIVHISKAGTLSWGIILALIVLCGFGRWKLGKSIPKTLREIKWLKKPDSEDEEDGEED